jgi:hypothetical protein
MTRHRGEGDWELQAARYTQRMRDLNGGRDPHAWKRDRAEDDPSWFDGPARETSARGEARDA